MTTEGTTDIERAVRLLSQDELVVIPTETVYGLAGNAFSEKAVQEVYRLKNRPPVNPLIVHIKGTSALEDIARNIPDDAFALAEHFWPGPLTLVLDKQDHISSSVTANKSTVGVRVPNHGLTLELLNSLDFPLVAPSANRSNHISPTHPKHVRSSFGERTPFILDGGACTSGIESTIIGLRNDGALLYRHGAISREEIEDFLNCKLLESSNPVTPDSPGMFKKHYSPDTETLLTRDMLRDIQERPTANIGVIRFRDPLDQHDPSLQRILSPSGNLAEAAANLYSSLHGLDQLGLDLILVEEAPDTGLGMAINDRLKRASHH